MSLQSILITGLVLAALLYAVAALIYFRKGMRTMRRWYTLIGTALLSLAILGFGGVFLGGQWAFATIAFIGGTMSIVYAMQWRPPTGQGIQP